jgi:multiple sugar transport system ATP-binding protein
MSNVRLKGLCKNYGALEILRDINLEMRDHQFTVLLGPSGCGKSTTLRLLAGLEPVTSGRIFIGDTDVTDLEPRARDISMVFQNYALYPSMTVAQNLGFGLKAKKMPAAQIRDRVNDVAELLDISALLKRKPRELSGGQQQRVAIGRAIVREPKLFLFDEPLSNLDAKLRVEMRIEILRLHKRLKATTVYVTHDQEEAMTMADRIVIMNGGQIEQTGTPEQIYFQPATRMVAGFIGSPAMNFLDGIADGNGRIATPVGQIGFAGSTRAGQPVQVGIRPDDLLFALHVPAEDNTVVLDCKITLTELLGARAIIHLGISDAGPLKAVVTHDIFRTLKIGSDAKFSVRPDALHVFDTASGLRISR